VIFFEKKTIFFEGLEGILLLLKKNFLTGFEPLNILKKKHQ
jgi:hypothetical protein